MIREAYSMAHLTACLVGHVAVSDPRFDRGYFRDCFALLDMIEGGATSADLLAFNGADGGSFDGWRDWFALTLAYMPPYLTVGRALEAFQGRADP